MFHTIVVDSPVGELRLIAGERGLRAILWGAEDAGRLASINEGDLVQGRNGVLDQAVAELEEYFAGTRREFDLALDPVGTLFQQSAWMLLRTIPYGRTMSYGEQARRLGELQRIAIGDIVVGNPYAIRPMILPIFLEWR